MQILKLELLTRHPLQNLSAFYTGFLGKEPLDLTSEHLTLQIGTSQLRFAYRSSTQPACYHFAFNIPENQFDDALAWVSQKVNLISNETGQMAFHSEN